MQRPSFGQEDALVFFGQDSLAYTESGEGSAEERIKAYALGEPERGLAAARRRVVRRPLGSGYQAQAIVFAERDAASSALSASEPLSELLMQLTSSRKAAAPGSTRTRDSAGSSVLSSLTGLTAAADGERKRANSENGGVPATPAQQLRACFVQELMLSALAQPLSALDHPL